jgi:hypothetical protein
LKRNKEQSAQAFSPNQIASPRQKKKTGFLLFGESGRTQHRGLCPIPKRLTQRHLGKSPRRRIYVLFADCSLVNAQQRIQAKTGYWKSHVISVRNCAIQLQRGTFSLICHRKKTLLITAILCRLPAIQQELNNLVERTNIELHDLLSPPSSEPLREILRLITDLSRAVEKQVEGVPGSGGLLQQIRPQQEEFRTAIRTIAPRFVPKYREVQEDSELTSTHSVSNVDWGSHQRLLFVEGEEVYEEIGLDSGKELFIDDILETTQWYTIMNILHFTFTFACLQQPFNPGMSPENYRITTRS